MESNFQNSPGPQFQEASDIVYHHFDDPSHVILNAPVNDYLQEHNSKYYHYAVGGKATQSSSHKVIKEKEDMEAPVRTYDFVIGDDSTTNRPDFKLRQPPPITKTIQKTKNYYPIPHQRKVPIVETRTTPSVFYPDTTRSPIFEVETRPPPYYEANTRSPYFEAGKNTRAPFYPTMITPHKKPFVIKTTPVTTTTTTTTTSTTTTTTTTTTTKPRIRTPTRFTPKYKRKLQREETPSHVLKLRERLKQKENEKGEKGQEEKKPKYSYKDVPRYHLANQVVAVRYPSDENEKFPHFPQVDFDSSKLPEFPSLPEIQHRPRKKEISPFDSQPLPSRFDYKTKQRTTTTVSSTTTSATSTYNREWGMKLGDTTVQPKFMETSRVVPTRGPVVKEGQILRDDLQDQEWFKPGNLGSSAFNNDPLLPPLMPGYGAPDLYGQDLYLANNNPRAKRKKNSKPENIVQVTTYKPQFVIPNHLFNDNQADHERRQPVATIPKTKKMNTDQGHFLKDKFHPLKPLDRPQNNQQQMRPRPPGPSPPYGLLPLLPDSSRLPTQSEISYLQPSALKPKYTPKRSPPISLLASPTTNVPANNVIPEQRPVKLVTLPTKKPQVPKASKGKVSTSTRWGSFGNDNEDIEANMGFMIPSMESSLRPQKPSFQRPQYSNERPLRDERPYRQEPLNTRPQIQSSLLERPQFENDQFLDSRVQNQPSRPKQKPLRSQFEERLQPLLNDRRPLLDNQRPNQPLVREERRPQQHLRPLLEDIRPNQPLRPLLEDRRPTNLLDERRPNQPLIREERRPQNNQQRPLKADKNGSFSISVYDKQGGSYNIKHGSENRNQRFPNFQSNFHDPFKKFPVSQRRDEGLDEGPHYQQVRHVKPLRKRPRPRRPLLVKRRLNRKDIN